MFDEPTKIKHCKSIILNKKNKKDYKKLINSLSFTNIKKPILLERLFELNKKINKSKKKNKEKINNQSEIEETTTKDTSYNITSTNNNKSNEEKINVIFEWTGEVNDKVTMTGNFLRWNINVELTKNPTTGNYEFKIPLKEGRYEFRFEVDGEKKCSINYNKLGTGADAVNYIDVYTNKKNSKNKNNIKNIKQQNEQQNDQQNDTLKNDSKEEQYTQQSISFNESGKSYGKYVLPKTEYKNPSKIPQNFKDNFNMNNFSNQKSIGNKVYLNLAEHNLLTENNSYKSVLCFPHVNLNHIIINNISSNADNDLYKIGFSEHHKHKVTTFVYYKPNKLNK